MATRNRAIPPDLFDIPRSVEAARKVARAIGAPLTARRYRSMAAADRAASRFLDRQHRPRPAPASKPSRERSLPTGVILTRRELSERAEQRQLLAEQLTFQRIRTLDDAIDAGAPPATVVRLAKDWNVNPALWWSRAKAKWAESDDWEDVTSREVFSNYHDSPEGNALPEN